MTQEIIFQAIELASFLGILLLLAIFLIIYQHKKERLQMEYLKTLSDHEKAIIKTYENITPKFGRKKKK